MLANDIRYDTPLYIRELQSALRDIHFLYPNEIPLINIDGIFGPETTEVILAAQRLAGREATGIVDYETWMWLFAVRRNGIRNKASINMLDKAVPLDSENETVRT
ncbi:MAG: peptidoglycan-binding protein, partial [Clostridia bacterium]|nr:peptidoglycan-binding protein [Clostridia bacterium]